MTRACGQETSPSGGQVLGSSIIEDQADSGADPDIMLMLLKIFTNDGDGTRKETVMESDDNPMNCFIALVGSSYDTLPSFNCIVYVCLTSHPSTPQYNLSMGEHIGTHMDAPFHFNPKGWTTDQVIIDKQIIINNINNNKL